MPQKQKRQRAEEEIVEDQRRCKANRDEHAEDEKVVVSED